MATVPTVKVVDEDTEYGYRIINRDDYDSSVHELYGDVDDGSEEFPELVLPEGVDYELARNGYWTVYRHGEEVDSGRTREALYEALEEYAL